MGTAKRDRQRANRQQRLEELAKEAKRSKTRKWALWIGVAVPVAIVVLFLIARHLRSEMRAAAFAEEIE